jgi:SAM-dependent methyltransferase
MDQLAGRLVLDVGCGFGRHLYCANEAGAETVGIDLSGGVDLAYRNNAQFPRCHVVQANIFDRPFREGSFDVVWSFGVLHHLPDPRAGFDAMVALARPRGGVVTIWVYGYRGMAFTYRLSHMRGLHRLTRTLSSRGRVRASRLVAAALTALYWEPLRLARRLGLSEEVERLPLAVYLDHPWPARVAAVHDRLSTPITHFHDRDELLEWMETARLSDVRVEDTNRRGWRASGRRSSALSAVAER